MKCGREKQTGIVRAPSLATLLATSAPALPAWAPLDIGGWATTRLWSVFAAISSPSRRFHSARTSAEGAHPRIPGWIRPANRTWGIWREEQKMPSKSQIDLALQRVSQSRLTGDWKTILTLRGKNHLTTRLHSGDERHPQTPKGHPGKAVRPGSRLAGCRPARRYQYRTDQTGNESGSDPRF